MFKNREEVAKKLTLKILPKIKDGKVLVVALPRGAVVMGKIIAEFLSLPLDIVVIKKIGAPFNNELAIGAVAGKNVVFWNKQLISKLKLDEKEMEKLKEEKQKEREKLEKTLRRDRKEMNSKGKTVILVDDGVATGATVMAANKYFKKQGAKKVFLATPVISIETFKELNKFFDAIIVLRKVSDFYAVGQFYEHFPQVTNREVIKILGKN